MNINAPEISDYCILHSTTPSQACREIEKYTRENIPMSVMLSGPLVGSFLGFLTSLVRPVGRPTRALEVGTFTGYSALSIAERLPVNGRLITLDVNEDYAKIARRFWDKSPAGEHIQLMLGDAAHSMRELAETFDLVFIDADKPGYIGYLERALELLSPNGVIVCDNALYGGEVLWPDSASENGRALSEFNYFVTSQSNLESVLLPVRDGLRVIRRRA